MRSLVTTGIVRVASSETCGAHADVPGAGCRISLVDEHLFGSNPQRLGDHEGDGRMPARSHLDASVEDVDRRAGLYIEERGRREREEGDRQVADHRRFSFLVEMHDVPRCSTPARPLHGDSPGASISARSFSRAAARLLAMSVDRPMKGTLRHRMLPMPARRERHFPGLVRSRHPGPG